MVGIISSVVLAGVLTADPTGFTFEGPRVTARTTSNTGYFTQGPVPYTDLFERGSGWVDFSVQERIAVPQATYGDVGRLEASFTLGATVYRVELDRAGFPPAPPGSTTPQPPPPAQPIAGGVVVDQDLHGGAMLGFPNMTRVRAAAAIWGVGRLWRNGQLITDTALIHAAALEQGAHADDDTFRVLPVARPGDTELNVLVWNLPLSAEPRGFVQFDFDDVAITRDGINLPAVAVVPNAGVFLGLAPPSSPVPGGTALGTVPNTAPTGPVGVGGSGLAGGDLTVLGPVGTDGLSDPRRTQQLAPVADTTLPGVAIQEGNLLGPFLSQGRVALGARDPSQAVSETASGPPPVPEAFTTQTEDSGRTALNVTRPGSTAPEALLPGNSTVPVVPEAFQNDARVRVGVTQPQATLNGFVPLTSAQSFIPSTSGSFSVVPLVPGVSGANLAFGGSRIAAGLVTTPSPAGVQTAAVPLVASPQPLNAQGAVPFVSSPTTFSGLPAVPLISTPPPLGTLPSSAALPGATPTASPGTPGAVAPLPGPLAPVTPSVAPGAVPIR